MQSTGAEGERWDHNLFQVLDFRCAGWKGKGGRPRRSLQFQGRGGTQWQSQGRKGRGRGRTHISEQWTASTWQMPGWGRCGEWNDFIQKIKGIFQKTCPFLQQGKCLNDTQKLTLPALHGASCSSCCTQWPWDIQTFRAPPHSNSLILWSLPGNLHFTYLA